MGGDCGQPVVTGKMPRKSAIENTEAHDEMLAVLVIIVGTVGGLIAGGGVPPRHDGTFRPEAAAAVGSVNCRA